VRNVGEILMNIQDPSLARWCGSGRRKSPRAVATYRCAAAVIMLAALLSCAPSYAATSKDKMATCKFGADDQHLKGKARAAFMKKCTSNQDEPRGAAAPAQH
jgi:psiF repeat